MSQIHYHWFKSPKYYHIHLQPNLFGGVSVIKSWGTFNSKRSGHKIIMCDSEEEADNVVIATIKRRKARDYLPMSGNRLL